MPRRIQRKRTPGWRKPLGAVYVGRPSRWGNPFEIGVDVDRAEEAVARFIRDELPTWHPSRIAAPGGKDVDVLVRPRPTMSRGRSTRARQCRLDPRTGAVIRPTGKL